MDRRTRPPLTSETVTNMLSSIWIDSPGFRLNTSILHLLALFLLPFEIETGPVLSDYANRSDYRPRLAFRQKLQVCYE